MNDRFKFRVWCKNLEKYVDNVNLSPKGIIFYSGCVFNADHRDYIIEQCTGLKDKNGNLIYENDRIKVRNEPGIIHFGFYRKTDEHFDGIYGWYIDWDKNPCWLRQDLGYFITEGIEIIGNIHEQAEQKDK